MLKRPGFVLACLFTLSACPAGGPGDNVLVDMFAWWNEAIQTEGGFTREAFGRWFTEDAEIIVNDVVLVHGLDAMVEHFRGIQQRTEFVEIVLPFEEGFREGDKIFTHHLIRARENGQERLSHVMGYAIVEDGKLALVNFLSYTEPVEPAAEARLAPLVDRYIGMIREEERDEGLPDVSTAAFSHEIDARRELLDRLLAVPTEGLALEQDIDRRLLIGLLKSWIREAEARRLWENDPTLYLPSRQIGMALEPASASPSERAEALAALLGQLPARLDHGRQNLKRPPARFTEEAIFQTEGLLGALEERAPAIVQEAGDAGPTLRAATGKASKALTAYLAFLQGELLPVSDGNWALGEDNYNYIVRERWFLDDDADALLQRGRAAFAETEALAQQVAARIDPGRHWIEVYEDLKNEHPTADGLKQAYQQEIDAARLFLIEHRVVTLPEGERVITVDTPPAMRRSSPYGTFDSVGPFEEGLLGRLVLTPVEDWMSPEQRAERLRSHHRSWIPIIAVHEAYPGHHVQALKIKENPDLLRSVVRESIFSEGWGLYCEELMFQLGFLEGDDVRLSQLRNRLWRAARVILDTQLHTGRIDFEEAVDFLVDKVRFDRYSAELEVGMYLRRPTYVLGYLIGMQEIAAIRDDWFEAYGEPSPLAGFYDRLLRVGAIPPALVREELFRGAPRAPASGGG